MACLCRSRARACAGRLRSRCAVRLNSMHRAKQQSLHTAASVLSKHYCRSNQPCGAGLDGLDGYEGLEGLEQTSPPELDAVLGKARRCAAAGCSRDADLIAAFGAAAATARGYPRSQCTQRADAHAES